MFEILVVVLFVWLFISAIRLAFKVAWSLAKIIAVILFVLALPALILGLLFAGGLILLVPIAMIAIACGILKVCV